MKSMEETRLCATLSLLPLLLMLDVSNILEIYSAHFPCNRQLLKPCTGWEVLPTPSQL